MRLTPIAAAVPPSAQVQLTSPLVAVAGDERTPSMADWCEQREDGVWVIKPGTYTFDARGNVLRFEPKRA